MITALSLVLAITPLMAQEKVYVATENREKVIGSLRWEITDINKKVVGKGSKTPKAKDVRIYMIGEALQRKEISLGNHFLIELSDDNYASKSEMTGFALNGQRDDRFVFAWDWFSVQGNRAPKLQEGGVLGLKVAKVGKYWEIVKTDFQTDISLRLNEDPRDSRETWRIKVYKGSTITWPSVGSGKVITN